MEIFAILSIPLLFSISMYFLVYRKDEKFLNKMVERIQVQRNQIRELQIQVATFEKRLQVIVSVIQNLQKKKEESPVNQWDQKTPTPAKVAQTFLNEQSLNRLEKEITTIKEVLRLQDNNSP